MRSLTSFRWRRAHVVAVALLAVAATSFSAPTTSTATPLAATDAHRAFIDPVLIKRVAAGPATAIVSFDERTTNREELTSYLAAHGVRLHAFQMLPVAYGCASSLQALHNLAAAPGVMSVYGERALTPALDQSVPTAFNGDPHHVWDDLGVTGKGVGIAVLDTGIDASHPDLEYHRRTKINVRVILSHRDVFGPSQDPCIQDTYTQDSQDSELTSGHGTHIASVAAGDGTASGGRYVGVAPQADLMGVGIADTVTPRANVDATQTQLSLLGAIAGFNFILLNGVDTGALSVKVILAGWVQSGLYDPWHPMALTLQDMAAFGITVVFPAGNDGPTPSDCSEASTCHINAWSGSQNAIIVAATPKTSRTAVEPYSSRGDAASHTFHDETFTYEPTIAAPGTRVVAARRIGLAPLAQPPGSVLGAHGDGTVGLDRRYVALTGTSVSAAHVAGAIALMQQASMRTFNCYLSPGVVRSVLQSTATPIPGASYEDVGAGAIDITHAVNAILDWPSSIRPC